MSSSKKAVRITWSDASGGGDVTLDFIAPSTTEAVCMMLDHMDGAGLDPAGIDGLTIVAKSGYGAEQMLRDDNARFEQERERRLRCAA